MPGDIKMISEREYLPIPNVVVIDITEELINFYMNSNDMEGFELSAEEIVREISMGEYINDKLSLESGLDALHQDMQAYQSQCNGFDNSRAMAEQVARLASDIYRKLDSLGLYTPLGLFPFTIGGFIDVEVPYFIRKEDF